MNLRSRVKQLSSLIVEPMTFDRLKSIKKSNTLKYRQQEEERLNQLFEIIKKLFKKQVKVSAYTCNQME